MLRGVIAFCLLILSLTSFAGGCPSNCEAHVNDVKIFQSGNSYSASGVLWAYAWAGNCYVGGVDGNSSYCNASIYFKRGDTIYLGELVYGQKMREVAITQPGNYRVTNDYCLYGGFSLNYYTIAYLPDSLAPSYATHFDRNYLDSVAAVEKILNDSLAALPATFYPNPIGETITFECFKTVQPPFDFQAFDYQGRCVLSRRVEFSDSYQTQTIDVSGLQAGTYVAKYFINSKQYMRQIVKL